MTDALSIVPETRSTDLGVDETAPIAKALINVLADTYRLVVKTHAYHWNVEGPLFYSVHNLTETQYGEMFEAADVLAERVRALGHLAPLSIASLTEHTQGAEKKTMSAGKMCADLADDHEELARSLHRLIEMCAEKGDPVTEDLATARSAFHQKAAWMLRSISKA